MTSWEVHTKQGASVPWGCLEEKHLCNWAASWTSCFFMDYHFYLKEQLTNCGYSDLGIWQSFFQKWTKWVCFFKENNWQYFLTMIKFELSSIVENLTSATLSLTVSQYFSRWGKNNQKECDFSRSASLTDQYFLSSANPHMGKKVHCKCRIDQWILTHQREKNDMISDSTLQLAFKKRCLESFDIRSKRGMKILLPFLCAAGSSS